MRQAIGTRGFSARAYDKTLKVSRTIADLEASDAILPRHVSEVHPPDVWRAVNYRTPGRRLE